MSKYDEMIIGLPIERLKKETFLKHREELIELNIDKTMHGGHSNIWFVAFLDFVDEKIKAGKYHEVARNLINDIYVPYSPRAMIYIRYKWLHE